MTYLVFLAAAVQRRTGLYDVRLALINESGSVRMSSSIVLVSESKLRHATFAQRLGLCCLRFLDQGLLRRLHAFDPTFQGWVSGKPGPSLASARSVSPR